MFLDQPENPYTTDLSENIKAIRQHLRRDGTGPAFFELAEITSETNLVEYLREWVKENGYDYDELKIRSINRDCLRRAITTGTDRDSKSKIIHFEEDEEEVMMREAGLNPLDAGRVTYVTTQSLAEGKSWTIPDNPLARSLAYLIYAPQGLRPIGNVSNGLHMFIDPRLIQRSLLAVISPIPRSEVQSQKI